MVGCVRSVVPILLSFALLTGCKSSQQAGVPQADLRILTINGAGASFPNPIYSKWFAEYSRLHPGVRINYQPIGSGGGIRQVSLGIVDFGASDGPMTDVQLQQSSHPLLHIPTVLGAVVPVYNLPGISAEVRFSPEVMAGIYLGSITYWDDQKIIADNPGVKFPHEEILPVYRSDGSGTTFIFTDYLSKVSPAWAQQVGNSTSVKWPAGIGQKGNEGVAGMVREAPYAFGYVELVYALQNHMTFGLVRNGAGQWIKATPAAVTAAAEAQADTIPADFRVSLTNAGGMASYPICSFTWLLVPQQSADATKGRQLHDFLLWMLSEGEQEAAAMGYAPLPRPVAERLKNTVASIR